MKKSRIISLNILVLLFFSSLFLILGFSSKQLLAFDSRGFLLSETVFNILCYFIYYIFLTVFVAKGKTIYSEHYFDDHLTLKEKLCINKVVLLLIIQAVINILQFLIQTFIPVPFITNIVIVLYWIAIYIVVTYKDTSNNISKKAIALIALIATFAIVTYFTIYFKIESEYRSLFLKSFQMSFSMDFLATSLQILEIVGFIQIFVNNIFDMIMGSLLIVTLTLRQNFDQNNTRLRTHIKRIPSRVISICLLAFVIIVVCVFSVKLYGCLNAWQSYLIA